MLQKRSIWGAGLGSQRREGFCSLCGNMCQKQKCAVQELPEERITLTALSKQTVDRLACLPMWQRSILARQHPKDLCFLIFMENRSKQMQNSSISYVPISMCLFIWIFFIAVNNPRGLHEYLPPLSLCFCLSVSCPFSVCLSVSYF